MCIKAYDKEDITAKIYNLAHYIRYGSNEKVYEEYLRELVVWVQELERINNYENT